MAGLWPVPPPPVPEAYPPSGHYPQDSPYPLGDQYRQDSPYSGGGHEEPAGQYPLTGAFPQLGPSQPWPEAPAGAMPAVGAPALPVGPDQYSQGDAYMGPYGNGPGQFPPGQFPPGQFGPVFQYGRGGQGLLGMLPFKLSPVALGVAVAFAVGILLVVVGANALA